MSAPQEPYNRHKNKLTPETYVPWPLDIRVLELLPDEGLIGGVHHAGRKASAIRNEINEVAGENIVTSGQVSGRMRTMEMLGMVVSNPATGGIVWARTKTGKQWLLRRQLAASPDAEEAGGDADSKSDDPVASLDERRAASG